MIFINSTLTCSARYLQTRLYKVPVRLVVKVAWDGSINLLLNVLVIEETSNINVRKAQLKFVLAHNPSPPPVTCHCFMSSPACLTA